MSVLYFSQGNHVWVVPSAEIRHVEQKATGIEFLLQGGAQVHLTFYDSEVQKQVWQDVVEGFHVDLDVTWSYGPTTVTLPGGIIRTDWTWRRSLGRLSGSG